MADKIVPQEACMLCFPEACTCQSRDKRKRKAVKRDELGVSQDQDQ